MPVTNVCTSVALLILSVTMHVTSVAVYKYCKLWNI